MQFSQRSASLCVDQVRLYHTFSSSYCHFIVVSLDNRFSLREVWNDGPFVNWLSSLVKAAFILDGRTLKLKVSLLEKMPEAIVAFKGVHAADIERWLGYLYLL